ncbi:mitochondrial mRNA pseudouridine synthase RPUSD3 isoform X2 [Sceloporus undulatus]|uniref:mitochondrial mRNA pseudouridine synthase RPUSD3 isoform X2 n=1 Tax=Sceloporus undulatus TaxID=8520 RepID=UPI001C4C1831|nr:mitochondrial mRNA pseudouridine synthase RPUSD3 isoform X2 [Sceloporus undulatus]
MSVLVCPVRAAAWNVAAPTFRCCSWWHRGGGGGARAPFSTRAWYQMLLKQRGSGKAAGDGGKSILGPASPLGRQELLKVLEESLVHRDDALLAINKPPGLPVTGKPGELTLLSLLLDLSQKLGLPQDLQVIRAAGKESSGLVLLSSCPNTIRHVHNFYIQSRRARNPTATYCAITTRIPETSEGEISTGLKLIQVEDFDLVVPVASPSHKSLQRKEVKKTLTRYKVLDSHEGCALLQLQPLTVFPSQLLVHLTLILSPALGDHIYSSRVGTVLGEPFLLPAESTLPRIQVPDLGMLPFSVLEPYGATKQANGIHGHHWNFSIYSHLCSWCSETIIRDRVAAAKLL